VFFKSVDFIEIQRFFDFILPFIGNNKKIGSTVLCFKIKIDFNRKRIIELQFIYILNFLA